MRILITGATGFIGSHLAHRLARDGHAIVACARQASIWRERLPSWEWLNCDFMRDTREEDWVPRIGNVDLVINAVGIIGEGRGQSFRQVQTEAPQALFSACARVGVKVIQISALGADNRRATVPFLCSKREADDHLWRVSGECVVLYPSIVIGEGGDSTSMFCRLAVLPVVPLPGGGEQRINPVHIDDVCDAVAFLVSHWPGAKQRVWLTGGDVFTVRELLGLLRERMGLGRAIFMEIPMAVLDAVARVGEFVAPAGVLRRETLSMLESVVAPEKSGAGLTPRPLREALWSLSAAAAWHERAIADNIRPLLVVALSVVWIFTGLVSVWWNVSAGYELMASAGVTGPIAALAIYGGGMADVVLGVLLLTGWQRRFVCFLQCGLMIVYLCLASVLLPAMWLDPLGALTKTLPMLMVTVMLAMSTDSRQSVLFQHSNAGLEEWRS